MKELPQALKPLVQKITLHSGLNEDCTFEWEEVVFTYEGGKEELVSRVSTDAETPEDNILCRAGTHNILRVMQAVEVNPKCIYEALHHEDCYGYLEDN